MRAGLFLRASHVRNSSGTLANRDTRLQRIATRGFGAQRPLRGLWSQPPGGRAALALWRFCCRSALGARRSSVALGKPRSALTPRSRLQHAAVFDGAEDGRDSSRSCRACGNLKRYRTIEHGMRSSKPLSRFLPGVERVCSHSLQLLQHRMKICLEFRHGDWLGQQLKQRCGSRTHAPWSHETQGVQQGHARPGR